MTELRPVISPAAARTGNAPALVDQDDSLTAGNLVTGQRTHARSLPSAPETIEPVSPWITLDEWSETHQPDTRWQLLSSTSLVFEFDTANHVITFVPGSQIARVDGLACWLGFAPRSTNGHLYMHTLDAQKNVLPLVSLCELPSETNRVIVIDPGHGGGNKGAPSVLGDHFEKEFTLDWALRLQPLLASNGWTTVLTRTNDIDLSLADRVAIAEHAGAACFLSLHFNSTGGRSDQSGLETYCVTPAGLPSTLTREFEDDPAQVFPNNAYDAQNLRLAIRLHRTLVKATGAPDRGVRRARFMSVLRDQNRPAVLLEGGYLSNPTEAGLIGEPEYRQRLAEAVAGGLCVSNDAHELVFTNAPDLIAQ